MLNHCKLSIVIRILAIALIPITAAYGSNVAFTTPALQAQNAHQTVLYLNERAWLNDIGTLLYGDDDGDSYFSGLSLSIDADSSYSSFDVYAVINISGSLDGSTSLLTEQLHTTLPFTVYGRSATDEYRVDIDLVRNYTPGTYDLQVLLVDARNDRVLDVVDAFDFRNLNALPLESSDNQSFSPPIQTIPEHVPNDDIFVTEYAGGTGAAFIALLIMGLVARIGMRGRA